MSSRNILQIPALAIGVEERSHAERFISENKGSTLADLLHQVLLAQARDQSVEFIADDAELTPNDAARILKMSRPHLLKFLDNGDLPFHRVGTHRRIKYSDLQRFMKARDQGREFLANALADQEKPLDPSPSLTAEELSELSELL